MKHAYCLTVVLCLWCVSSLVHGQSGGVSYGGGQGTQSQGAQSQRSGGAGLAEAQVESGAEATDGAPSGSGGAAGVGEASDEFEGGYEGYGQASSEGGEDDMAAGEGYGGGGMAMGGGYGGQAAEAMAGGYGGFYGGGYVVPPLKFALVLENDGVESYRVFEADRVFAFQYERGSLKPQQLELAGFGGGGYGDMGDMGGMYGAEAYGGDGGGYGVGAGDMGSGDVGMGAGGGGYGGGGAQRKPHVVIYAFVFDRGIEQRAEVRLVTLVNRSSSRGGMYARMGGYGGGDGGYGAESESDGGASKNGRPTQRYDLLESLVQPKTAGGRPNRFRLQPDELAVVSASIKQSVWKRDAIRAVQKTKSQPAKLAKQEELLRGILSEQYETQLTRQTFEVQQIERRIAQLREEIRRRQAAKERVVDVQLGRIVLEAQGLLDQ